MNINSSVILLNLLRIALGNSAEWKGEGSVDWKKVIRLARKQGVLAIAFDALEMVPAELRPSKNILLEWFGRVNTMEQVYELYVNTIKDLGRLIGSKGLYMMVIKLWEEQKHL
ncbi:nucleotidyltransferase family protein [Segatella copri]|uniref:nucleotidyltransferase family protein n=1 Tax=Segatella copri TaxID=165179 RepID=UPI002FF1FE49